MTSQLDGSEGSSGGSSGSGSEEGANPPDTPGTHNNANATRGPNAWGGGSGDSTPEALVQDTHGSSEAG